MTTTSVEDRLVDVPGGQVFVRSWTPEKSTTASPVVILHDSLGCVGLWREFPEALAQRLERPVVAYDRLGFGSIDFSRRIAGGVAGPAEMLILENCGHVPHREHPDEVMRQVSRFLDAGASTEGGAPCSRGGIGYSGPARME